MLNKYCSSLKILGYLGFALFFVLECERCLSSPSSDCLTYLKMFKRVLCLLGYQVFESNQNLILKFVYLPFLYVGVIERFGKVALKSQLIVKKDEILNLPRVISELTVNC